MLPRRRIILRDSITVLVLVLSAAALFAITSLLFRSFMARRAELGKRYATSGQQALRDGDAERAVSDLRTSLSYAPDETNNRLLLAEALSKANHPEQARGYFLGLLDAQPADGFINLQLARLARQRNDTDAALRYYRAAAVGNWSSDSADSTNSTDQRFHVQLELADYLTGLVRLPSARAELLIAAADAPEDASAYKMLAQQFERAEDASDALSLYRKTIKLNPLDADALYRAGRDAYRMDDFVAAASFLSAAGRESAGLSEYDQQGEESLLHSARRIQELTLSSDLPPQDRAEHFLRAAPIAAARFESCTTRFESSQLPPDLQRLQSQWKDAQSPMERRALLQDAASQEVMMKLIFDTEKATASVCGPPSGDDALLLQLANSPHGVH
jgi:Tfp pilus assembly protein PilF